MCELYRHFDSKGRLLYVGISLSTAHRLAGHRKASPWFNSIAWIEVERFATREEALNAELQAIRTEWPIWNKAGKVVSSAKQHPLKKKRPRRSRQTPLNERGFSPRVEEAYRELMAMNETTGETPC